MITPWLPADVAEEQALQLLGDSNWILQEKADGVHVFAEVSRTAAGAIVCTATIARSGRLTTLPRECADALIRALPVGSIVSGEAIPHGPFVVFDLLKLGAADVRTQRTDQRWETVRQLLMPVTCLSLQLVRSASTTAEKLTLYSELQAAGAEGVVYKRADSPYLTGRPAMGGPMLRWKWRKSIDVMVLRRPGDTRQSFEMFVWEPNPDKPGERQLAPLGSVNARTINPATRRPFYESLEPGGSAVAEVTYIYAGEPPECHLNQAVLQRLRDDKPSDDCTKDQVQVGPRWRVTA